MNIFTDLFPTDTYLFPKETIAQIIIVVLFLFFICWLIFIYVQRFRLRKISSQIDNCLEVGELSDLLNRRYVQSAEIGLDNLETATSDEAESTFKDYCGKNRVSEDSPVYKHLKAIFFTGFNESQLNVESLIKNTSSRIVSRNTMLRYLISLFIILGLLGTLSGLASSLFELSAILPGTEQLDDESLKNGLKTLLGKLSGSFTPSLLGVICTVISMAVFVFLQRHSYRVLQLLEHQTLTNWVPKLIPTPSQRMLAKLKLGEKQVEEMTEFTAKVSGETGELRTNIKETSASLKELNKAAAKLGEFTDSFARNMNQFAQDFKGSIERLDPIAQGFTTLYTGILEDSHKFQESTRRTLEDSQTFRAEVQADFEQRSEQLQTLVNSMKVFEKEYMENRQSTDAQIQATLKAAEAALQDLTTQKEFFVKEIIENVGAPIRENLKTELVNITEALNKISTDSVNAIHQMTTDSNTTIAELSRNVGSELNTVGRRMEGLEKPLENYANFMEETSKNVITSADKSLKSIREEFSNQNDNKEAEIQSLLSLDKHVQKLADEIQSLAGKIEKINQRSPGRTPSDKTYNPQRPKPTVKPGFFRNLYNKFRRR
jgi:ABC-type transporter Mla subunit MlaD